MELIVGNKTALILGASGLTGGFLLEYLLQDSTYSKVISIGRSKLDIDADKLEQYAINFDSVEDYASLFKCNDIFIALGTTIKKAGSKEKFYKVDFTYINDCATMAKRQGATQCILVSAVGADPDSMVFYNRVKGEAEVALKSLDFWGLHIFQPSILLGERNENRFGEAIAQKIGKGLDFVLGGLLSKYQPIEAEELAMAMVKSARRIKEGTFIYPSNEIVKIANS